MSKDSVNPAAKPATAADAPVATRPPKSSGGVGRLLPALRYALQGLTDAFRREASFRQELLLAALLIPVAVFFPFSSVERVMLIGCLVLVLIVELLNSGLEAVVDRISTDPHPMAGKAKDLGSAAVFLSLVLATLTWLAIAGPVLGGLFLSPL